MQCRSSKLLLKKKTYLRTVCTVHTMCNLHRYRYDLHIWVKQWYWKLRDRQIPLILRPFSIFTTRQRGGGGDFYFTIYIELSQLLHYYTVNFRWIRNKVRNGELKKKKNYIYIYMKFFQFKNVFKQIRPDLDSDPVFILKPDLWYIVQDLRLRCSRRNRYVISKLTLSISRIYFLMKTKRIILVRTSCLYLLKQYYGLDLDQAFHVCVWSSKAHIYGAGVIFSYRLGPKTWIKQIQIFHIDKSHPIQIIRAQPDPQHWLEVFQIKTLTCKAAEESEDAQVPQGGEGGRRVPPLHPEISALIRVQVGPQANAAHKKPGSSYFWERILPQERYYGSWSGWTRNYLHFCMQYM